MGKKIENSYDITAISQVAHGIRRRVLEHAVRNNGGYLSQACSAAEILAAMYLEIMNLGEVDEPLVPEPFAGVPGSDNPHSFTGAAFNGPKAPHLDRFILSPSQYALVIYAALIETGRMAPEGLLQFNQDGSTVEMIGAEHSPGMEVMTGSLGQGLSQAAGIALARRLRGDTGWVWLFMSDGEFQSGQNWEAMQAASFYKLDNIGIYVDMNGQQCDGKIDDVMNIEPFKMRLESFGAKVVEVDGHNPEALINASKEKTDGKPLVVLARTCPWQGLDILQARYPRLHYVRFSSDAERNAFADVLERF